MSASDDYRYIEEITKDLPFKEKIKTQLMLMVVFAFIYAFTGAIMFTGWYLTLLIFTW